MIQRTTTKQLLAYAAITLALLLQGCASTHRAGATNPADPLEPFNRTVFSFNEQLDRTIIKPVALAYRDVTPQPIRRGVSNFFDNLSDVWSLANSVFQLRVANAADSLFRVTVNTFWGLGGLFDVATEMQIPRHREDFGQTLGAWGMPSGAYLVLPVLGPSTVRDALGTLVDRNASLATRAENMAVRNSLNALGVVDLRARYLTAGDVLDEAALDKYTFAREVYIQRRSSLLGNAPKDKPEERFDLPETQPSTAAEPAAAPASAP